MANSSSDVNPLETIESSNKILHLAKEQIKKGNSYLDDLQKYSADTHVAIPFTQITEAPSASPVSDSVVQERLKELIAAKLKPELNISTLQIQNTINPIDQTENISYMPSESKIEARPIINDSVVITEDIVPRNPNILALATEKYPTQQNTNTFVPRNVSEEGFWSPELPLCKPSNVTRLENRLSWSDPDRQQFFEVDGNLKSDAPYVQQIPPPFPVIPPDHEGAGLLSFYAAQNEENVETNSERELFVEIGNIHFITHSLSSPEDVAAYRLFKAYRAYEQNRLANKIELYKKTFQALLHQLDELTTLNDGKQNDVLKEKKIELIRKILKCCDDYDREGNLRVNLQDELIRISHELKDSRASFRSTNVHLIWQKWNPEPEEIEADTKKLDEFIEMRARLIIQLEELLGNQTMDFAQTKETIMQRRKDLGLRNPGDPMWLAKLLFQDDQITPINQVPVGEQNRRTAMKNTQISVRVIVPNQSQYITDYKSLESNFESNINDMKKMLITKLPSSVFLEIIEMDTNKKERAIARVSVPVYVGLPPEKFTYEFSSDFQLPNGNLVTGTVDARVYISSNDKEKIMITIPDANSKIKDRLKKEPFQFISSQYKEDAKSFDPNDPYIASNLATLASHHAKQLMNNNFMLDAAANSIALNSFVPATDNFKSLLHRQQMIDEKRRKELLEKLDQNQDNSATKQQAVINSTSQYSDIVKESPMPTLPSLLSSVLKRFFMFRPLNPDRKERIASSSIQQYSKIIVHIIRCSSIPARDKIASSSEACNCFVRVTYDNVSKETAAINSTAPEWNERFIFDVSKNINEIPITGDLQQKRIRIDLFDKVTYQTIEDDREQRTSHIVFENRSIASISLPIDALWTSGNFDGFVTLNTPPAYLGYTNQTDPVAMKVFIAADPPLKLEPVVSGYESVENQKISSLAQRWIGEMLNNDITRNRFIKLFTHTKGSKPFLICRMIKSQKPPPSLEGKSPEYIARFVSLIPCLSDDALWNTSQEFLNKNAGNVAEHAALLCNIFKSRSDTSNAYLVFGYTINNGRTIFVLTKMGNSNILWDPNTGRKFQSTSSDCPMFSVGCVCDEKNVWANIQVQSAPWKIRWDFQATKDWKPLINGELPPFVSPQEDKLTFSPELTQDSTRSIASQIEQDVMLCIQRLRESHQTTQWNNAPQEFIYQIIDCCEHLAQGGEAASIQESMKAIQYRMKETIRNTRIFGTPFCLPFTDSVCIRNEVVNEIVAREIHLTEMKDISFCIKVRVYPYPNGRAAVWVFPTTIQNILPNVKRL